MPVDNYGSMSLEDRELSALMFQSGHICADCAKDILLTDDTVLISVVVPRLEGYRLLYPAFENAQGQFAYEPHFFHHRCWEALQESLREELDEYDCLTVADPYGVCQCGLCHSDIRAGEPAGMKSLGELRSSPRCPNGKTTFIFDTCNHLPEFWCLSCMRTLNESIITLWDEGIAYAGECSICTHERNWRTGGICNHSEDDEDETE